MCAPGATSKASAGVEASGSSTSENAPSSLACRSRKTLERPPRDGSGPRLWSTLAAFRGGASQVPCGGGLDQLRLVRVGRWARGVGDMTADLTTASQRRWRATPATQGRRATWCRRYASRALRAAAVRAVGLKSAAGLFGSPREDRKHFRGRAPDGAGAGLGAARRIRPASTSPLELRPAPDPRGPIYDPPARLQRGLSPPSGRSPTSCPKSEIIAHRARRRSSPRVHGRRLCTGDHWAATGPGIGARGAGPGDLVPRCCQSFRPQKAARARAQHAELRDTTALGPRSRPTTYVISVVQLRAEPQNGVGPEA